MLSSDAFSEIIQIKMVKKCVGGRGSALDSGGGAYSTPQSHKWIKVKGRERGKELKEGAERK